MSAHNVRDVCLVISAFRSDDAVARVLESVFGGGESPFGSVIVVDSQGSGALPALISQRGWKGVHYENAGTNLGSAGNLARRLELAAETNARYAYAINHDGAVDPRIVERLAAAARAQPSLGAVFPLRRMTGRDGRFDVTGRLPVPIFAVRVATKPRAKLLRVHWSSSNGALYNLEPVRRGLLPWADLWMGWEDLGYGWLLGKHGYEQVVLTDVEADDNYEYRRKAGAWLTHKATWYAYYYARNFLTVARRTQPPTVQAVVLGRVLLEFIVTGALRGQKRERLSFLARGLRDAMGGRTGKWEKP